MQNSKCMFFISRMICYIFIVLMILSCSKQAKHDEDRYIVLSPEIAEILAYLDTSNRIVGVTAECDFPAELQNIASVGNFGQYHLEKIISLKPTIVFTTALEQNEIAIQLVKMGIQTQQFYPKNIHDLLAMIDSLGVITGQTVLSDSLSFYLRNQFDTFLLQAQNRENKLKVFIEIYGNPIMSADNSSFLGSLLEYSGLENIFPILPRDYSRVNTEDVIRLNPDVIILTYPGTSVSDVKNRKGWGNINAVQNNMIFDIDDIDPDLILRATPRNVEGLKNLLRTIYGE